MKMQRSVNVSLKVSKTKTATTSAKLEKPSDVRAGGTKAASGGVSEANLKSKHSALKNHGVPYGNRTRVTAVKGRCPRPLDERDAKGNSCGKLSNT